MRQILITLIFLTLEFSVPFTSWGQITTNSALQIAEGQTMVRLQGRYVQFENSRGDLDIWTIPIVTAYGVTPKFTAFGIIPYQFRDFNSRANSFNESTSGIGDLQIFGRYTFISKNKTGEMVRMALISGMEFPTGVTDKKANGELLPRPLQPGTGSWNPFSGLVITRHTLAWHFDMAITYTRNTEDDNFKMGDELLVSISNTYRVIPWKMKMQGGFTFGMIEQNIRWSGNNQIDDITQKNTNTFSWSVLPGLQYIRKKLTLEAGVDIPVVDKSSTSSFEREMMLILSSRINF